MTSGRTVFSLVLLVCTLLLHTRDVHSLQCYMCGTGSVTTTPCNDPFDPAGIENCTAGTNGFCIKSKVNDAVLLRNCEPQLAQKNGCTHAAAAGQSADLCYCNTDFCNSAPSVTLPTFTFFSACALIIFIYAYLFGTI